MYFPDREHIYFRAFLAYLHRFDCLLKTKSHSHTRRQQNGGENDESLVLNLGSIVRILSLTI